MITLTKTQQLQSSRVEGEKAFHNNQSIDSNPYNILDKKHMEWYFGYIDARKAKQQFITEENLFTD